MRSMDERRSVALRHGATDFGLSDKENKLYYVVYNGRRICFGSKRFDYNGHNRLAWIARNSRFKNARYERIANTDKTKPCYWVNIICWPYIV